MQKNNIQTIDSSFVSDQNKPMFSASKTMKMTKRFTVGCGVAVYD